jgi:ElaB/YqjD/DUF883 family membrane-anchored ribosome-binding protein
MMSESTLDQDRIEENLARTRARMDGRLTELQDRLSPGQILDDLMAYFRGSEGGDFARNLMASVQTNPMPAALTGIGLAWLMASNPKPPQKLAAHTTSPAAWATDNEFDRHIRSVEEGVTREPDEPDSTFGSRLDDARAKVLGLTRNAQDTAETFGKRVQEGIASARQPAMESAKNISAKAGETATQMTDALGASGQAAQQMAGNLISMIGDNPVMLGAIGLAVGAVLGALVPQSEQEQAALIDVGRRAREGISGLSQEAVDRGAAVAKKVMEAGRESAAGQGLADKTPGHFVDEAIKGNLAGSVSEIAKDVLKAGESAVRKEGMGKDDSAPGSLYEGKPVAG